MLHQIKNWIVPCKLNDDLWIENIFKQSEEAYRVGVEIKTNLHGVKMLLKPGVFWWLLENHADTLLNFSIYRLTFLVHPSESVIKI